MAVCKTPQIGVFVSRSRDSIYAIARHPTNSRRPLAHFVYFHSEALIERRRLQRDEQEALARAIEKLAALGVELPFPHQSAVRGSGGLRELRPRGGKSRWRGVYARLGETFVILAVVPESGVDGRGFARGVAAAKRRRQEIEGGG